MKNELGKYIEEYSVRNKEKKCDKVYSVTNSLGFVKSSDYFSKEVYSKDLSNYKIVLKNMIAYNPSRINVGSVSIQKKEDMVIVSPLYIVFSVNSKKLLPKYVNYFLHSDVALHQISNLTSGSVRDSLKYTSLKRIIIPVYSTEEQEKIINTLELLDEIIYKKNNQLKYFDDYIQFRFIERFGSPIVNEFNFEVKKIRDIVIEVKYGTSKPAQKTGDYEYIRMNNITNDGYLDLSDIKYISLPENEIEKYLVKKGDILFNRTNSIDLVGKTAIFNFEKPMVIAGYIIRIRINEKYMLPLYLSTFMNLKSTKKILKNLSKGAVNQANINAKELQNIEIPLPPLSLQNEFADFVREVDKSKFVNINNSIKLLKSVQNNVFCQRKKFYNVDNIYEYDGKECRI